MNSVSTYSRQFLFFFLVPFFFQNFMRTNVLGEMRRHSENHMYYIVYTHCTMNICTFYSSHFEHPCYKFFNRAEQVEYMHVSANKHTIICADVTHTALDIIFRITFCGCTKLTLTSHSRSTLSMYFFKQLQ